jgi:putative sigma-54 modulation protein
LPVNLILSGRGVELDDALREYATEKLTRAQRFFDRIIRIEVELLHERNPRVKDPDRVEVTVKTPNQTLRVHGEGLDHFAAIDVAADRLEAQVRKHKERLVGRNHQNHRVEAVVVGNDEEDEEGPQIVRMTPLVDKPLTPEEARMELEDRHLLFLTFMNASSMRPAVIFKRDAGDYGLIEHES